MSESNIDRRSFLGLGALATAAGLLDNTLLSAAPAKVPDPTQGSDKPVLTILHLTDTHIRPEFEAPARCRKILSDLRQRHPEINLVINTGDSIYAADYGHITRQRVEEQWKIWDEVIMPPLQGLPILHAIGNHDPWWAGPEGDTMRGYPYVCQRLGITNPYYATRHGGWDMVVLNNSRGSVDEAQFKWLGEMLVALPSVNPLLVATHVPIYSLAGLTRAAICKRVRKSSSCWQRGLARW